MEEGFPAALGEICPSGKTQGLNVNEKNSTDFSWARIWRAELKAQSADAESSSAASFPTPEP